MSTENKNDTSTRLISDIIYLTQRASGQTCEIAIRTIERQAARYLSKYPGEIKNASAYSLTVSKLCSCILSLKSVATGTGSEIRVKRKALDLLLALSNEIEYSPSSSGIQPQSKNQNAEQDVVKIAV